MRMGGRAITFCAKMYALVFPTAVEFIPYLFHLFIYFIVVRTISRKYNTQHYKWNVKGYTGRALTGGGGG